MDFGDILEQWSMRKHGVVDKDSAAETGTEKSVRQAGRRRLKAMRPEDTCDLHGLTRTEALQSLDSFIGECVRRKLKKVLIVHGKGIHSENGPVLAAEVRAFIEADSRLGAHGQTQGKDGGSGATWVMLKQQ